MMDRWRTAARVAAAAVALLAVLAALGVLMMPRWRPEPYDGHIAVASADPSVVPSVPVTDHEGAYRTRERNVTIHLEDGGSVPAVLREPLGAPGRRPACLFVHGSGTGDAADFGDIANAMSSAGIVTLVPAKRTDGYTPLHRDYPRFARDYGTALDLLRMIPGVDPARTGLYAESEGTWISMLMTEHRRDVAFSILSSAPVYSGREQMAMAVGAYMHEVGAPRPVIEDAAKLMSLDFAPFDLRYADFDAADARASLTMPVLVNYGVDDTAMPIEQGARTVIADAARHGNRDVTVRYFKANHQMRAGTGLFTPGLPLADGYTRTLSDWVNGVAAGAGADGWATPRIAGATPHQRYAVPDSTSSGIIGSLGVLVAFTAAGLLCFVCAAAGSCFFALAELARRRRLASLSAQGAAYGRFPAVDRRRRADHAPVWPGTSRAFARTVGYSRGLVRLMGCCVASCVVTLAGLTGYLAYMGVAALYGRRGPAAVTDGGFAALRVAGVVSAVLCAWLIVRLWHAWRVRRAYLGHGTQPAASLSSTWLVGRWHWLVALLVLAGMLFSLVVMAFWGLFSL